MKKNIVYFAAMILAFAVLGYGCSSKTAQAPAVAPAGAVSVKILNFAFVPDTVVVKTGSTVTWTNEDTAPHTATDLAGSFDSGNLATNASFTFAFSKPGTFTYHCLIHSMMKKAVVIVTN
jgi:plastocyanin